MTPPVPSPSVRVLVVDDNPGDRDLIQIQLEEPAGAYDVLCRGSLSDAYALLASQTVDVVVLDLGLPDSQGVDTYRRIRERHDGLPVVVMTGLDNEEAAVEALRAGAQDYLVKGRTDPGLLGRSLRYAIERHTTHATIDHLNQVLLAIRNINQLIVRETDPDTLIRKACELLIETRGYGGAWIALQGDDGLPASTAHAGWTLGFEPLEAELRAGRWPECRLAARASTEGLVALVPAEACPQCPVSATMGAATTVAVMLRHGETMFGMLEVCVPPNVRVDKAERDLLSEVAGDIAFALHTMAERRRAARVMAARLELLEFAVDHTLHELLVKTLDVICEMTGSAIGFYHMVNAEEQALTLQAWSTRTTEEFCAVSGAARHYPISQAGVWADCVRTRHPVIHNDYASLPARKGLPEGHAPVLRELVVPVLRGDLPQAILGVGNKLSEYTDSDVSLVTYLADVAWEIAEHKRAEDALRARERKHDALLRNLPGMVYSTGPGWAARLISGSEPLCGYTSEELCAGAPGWPEIVLEADRVGVLESLASLAGRPGQQVREYRIVTRKGRIRWVEDHCCAVWNDQGEPAGVDGVIFDITARKNLEEQLLQSQRLEAIGRLAGGVAHDFNNLLTVINGNVAFAMDQVIEGDPLREDLEEIRGAGDRAVALTRQLLAFSRKQILEPTIVDLNRVIDAIGGLLRRLLGEDIDIAIDPDENLGRVEADSGQMEQVIVNLAVNARDAMPAGGKLTIETSNVELDEEDASQHAGAVPGRFVMLAISDTGCGMDAETRARVFEPFFTTKDKGKGTGLGLSTVYGIVRQSGGTIRVYSEPDHGTSFRIYLPRVDATASAVTTAPRAVEATGTETVLVVEDEDAVRRLAERILRKAGYRVLVAANGGEAIMLCERYPGEIELLLTDVVMPQMSGHELADRLRENEPALKVLYMSGYAENAIVHHGVLDAGTRFVGKPFSAPDLTRKVRDALDAE